MNWPHAPLHWFKEAGIYFITASTYLKQPLFKTAEDLDALQSLFFRIAASYEAVLQAWSFFANHYHLVVESPRDATKLRDVIREVHSISARDRNARHEENGRRVWFQFCDTHLTFQRSYLARLNYVNQNAVHHGLVENANNYRWCSAQWFEQNARQAFAESVRKFKTDRVKVWDDF